MITIKYSDIKGALIATISKLGLPVFYEDINKIRRPCYYIDLVNYQKDFRSNYREFKQLDFDIMYFSSDKEGNNSETIEALENLDNNFEVAGNKILSILFEDKSLNRYLTLKDTRINIVDNVGHYEFYIDLFDVYGKPVDYQLMQELKLEVNNE